MLTKLRQLLLHAPAAGAAGEGPALFAEGLCFYKLVWIFSFGCLLGYLLETVIVYLSYGYYMNRAGMVWGPFNQVYGFGAVLLSLVLIPMATRGSLAIFVIGALLGGGFEYLCSLVQEKCFGSVSWDYAGYATSIGGRTNAAYMLFWGGLALVYTRWIYPLFSGLVERIPLRWGGPLTWGLVIFFAVNLFVSSIAVTRWNHRATGIPAAHPVAHYLDRNYHDRRMEGVYPELMRLPAPGGEGGGADAAA